MAENPAASDRQLVPPSDGENWTGLSERPLPAAAASEWVVLPSCGGVVVFTGTARDHSVGRDGVTKLEYEAYEEQVVPRLDEIAAAARLRWPELGRIVLLHRIGEVPLTEAAVVVAVSAPHRAAAFEAVRFGIDTLKETVPIWKREDWSEGTSWGREAQHIIEVGGAVEAEDTAQPDQVHVGDAQVDGS
ncbi:MAG: molybdenum cofactor biosynthesis protein MoaE [Acidimicrobiales bacterium]